MFGNESIVYYLAFIPTILVAITLHEFAHARVALAFGDTTAHQQGRVSLNPLVHIDPIGFLGILLVGFGWGKPVPVDASQLRHPRADLLVSAAGPLTNFILAALAALLVRFPAILELLSGLGLGLGAAILITIFVQTNLVLALFNLIPIGPLDGAHVIQNLLPASYARQFAQFNHSYGYILLLLLVLSGYVMQRSILSAILGPPLQFFTSLLLGK
ncbi:MAG: site-2 protease family protein [Candidatus Omnitrophica bacterium]|nr:site-2 protease family protein [Candidatus Omnitrophota bacterium]